MSGGGCPQPGGGSCDSRYDTAYCGCWQGGRPLTPAPIDNRPGLDAVRYRVGTYSQFLATMRARLSSRDHPALGGLRTRDSADLSLALLDGWATVADVLTFYTERIANEGYLATATEGGSVLQLARQVGYAPRPGVSASVYLAYTVTAGHEVTIPAGSRVQSVPGPGELPATFETAEALLARGGHSTLPLRRSRLQRLTTTTLSTLDRLVLAGTLTEVRPGEPVVVTVPAADAVALFEVTAVTLDAANAQTTLSVALRHGTNLAAPIPPAPPVRTGRAVGAAADDGTTRLGRLTDALRKPPSVPPGNDRELRRDQRALFGGSSALLGQLVEVVVPQVAATLGGALANSTVPVPAPATVARMQVTAALFGHQAPPYPKYSAGAVVGYVDPMVTPLPVDPVHGRGAPPQPAAAPPMIDPPHYHPSTQLDLDSVYETVTAGSRVLLVNSALATPVALRTVSAAEVTTASALGLTGRISRLTLDSAWPDAETTLSTILRGTSVLAADNTLTLGQESTDDDDVTGDVVELDGVHTDLVPGRWVIVTGERSDPEIVAAQDPGHGQRQPGNAAAGTGVRSSELAMIASVEHRVATVPCPHPGGGEEDLPGDHLHTFLCLAVPLAYRYRRPTVTVYGNVVRATHGETRTEVLGSGDATRRFPQFALKQPPLTYLPAPTAAGATSTLEVFVDGVRWHEAEDLIGAGPNDRRYLVHTDDAGAARVGFGDGVHGAVPPTGVENVTATYRSGIGRGGNIDTGRITLATSKPLGVTEVVNPLPATGGADRESRDVTRRNAPLGVQALDRLVSVSDYEDFTRAFAGIGSAAARELSDGRRLLVHVTIAGIDDTPIDPTSDLVRTLRTALADLGDPDQDVRVAVRTLRLLVVAARVRVDPDRRWSDVEPAIRAALLARFGPGHRKIGQGVAAGEVLATVQAVPGVGYVDLDTLDALGETAVVSVDPAAGLTRRAAVPVSLARRDPNAPPGSGTILPAELLLLSPAVRDTLILSELP